MSLIFQRLCITFCWTCYSTVLATIDTEMTQTNDSYNNMHILLWHFVFIKREAYSIRQMKGFVKIKGFTILASAFYRKQKVNNGLSTDIYY